ncbi:hypothetical protein BaRGS_00005266 [Batillaria attramentaria]|uniref:UBX domain-containing protein n=1 Tax=Batillaria attramentaria TaxID=370345 RepID=A0ABD0LUL7_9CAEN
MAASVEALDELITQFCAVTGAEREIAARLLEACNGNLELAIGMHMDQEEASSSNRARSMPIAGGSNSQRRSDLETESESLAGASASVLPAADEEEVNGVRAPIPQKHEVLVEEAPKLTGFRGRRRLNRSVFDGFRDFQAEAMQQESMMITGVPVTKKHTLEDLFRPPIDMTYKGTFQSARDFGTSQNKWLLVNLQNVQEFACQVLNRDIWSSQTVRTLLRKHFVFWQVYHDSEEGKKYMQFYKVSQWPHIAVLDPVTGESLSDSIVDASEEAQLEAAIKASLAQQSKQQQPTPTSSSTTVPIESPSACISVNSDSECDSDDLETFTGSEDESNQGTSRSARSSSQEPSSSQRRNFSAVTNQTISSLARPGSSGSTAASSSDAGASGIPSPRHLFSGTLEDSSTSGLQGHGRLRVLEDSENDSSQGFRESYTNTPNSVEMLGGRCAEAQTIDSSSSSSILNVDDEPEEKGQQQNNSCGVQNNTNISNSAEAASSSGSSSWEKYFGDSDDPETILVIRFPNGQKDQLSLPCSSKLKALFLYCSGKGFGQDGYELVVNFPRRTISSLDPMTTVKDAELHPQETIFVQAR